MFRGVFHRNRCKKLIKYQSGVLEIRDTGIGVTGANFTVGDLKKYTEQISHASEAAKALDDYQYLMCLEIEKLNNGDPRRDQIRNIHNTAISLLTSLRCTLEVFKINPEGSREDLSNSVKAMQKFLGQIVQESLNPKNDTSINSTFDSFLSLKQAESKMSYARNSQTHQIISPSQELFEMEKNATLLGQEIAAITAFPGYSIREGSEKGKSILNLCVNLNIDLNEDEKNLLKNYSDTDQDSRINFYIQFQRKVERVLDKNLLSALIFGQNMVLFLNLLNSDKDDIDESVFKIISDLNKSKSLLTKGGKVERDLLGILHILVPYLESGIPTNVRKRVQTEILELLIK